MFTIRRIEGRPRALAAALAVSAVLISLLLPVQAATAAPGDLDVSVQVVDNPDGNPVSELRASIAHRGDGVRSLMGLDIGYSCAGTSDCLNATVKLDPLPLDPYYGTQRFASYNSVTLPAGASITGNANVGWTVSLGDVPSGFSASFRMLFNFQNRGVGVSAQSFFPDGFVFSPTVTMSATGQDPVTGSTSVPWRIDTPEPAVEFSTTPVARVDQDYTYTDFMSARCLWERTTAGHGEPVYECAREYTTVHTLPTGAVFVSASHGGVYDAATGTVTWSDSGFGAASGWGSLNNLGTPRTVTVRFPQSLFTDPDVCVISVTTSLHVDMTYLSGAEDSADAARQHEVNACTPFAAGGFEKSITRDSGTAGAPIVWEGSSRYWETRVIHRSNVPAIATIVDDDLDQAGLPVNRISLPNGAGTITATLDDGDVVVTVGTAYTAPTGRRIVAATVVSPTLVGPNQVLTDISRNVTYSVRYAFTVAAGVPDEGFQRTNTASASLEFPGTPELDTYPLGVSSQTVTVLKRPAVLTPRIARTVVGGGNPVAGTVVQFRAWADTSYQEPGVAYEPQYVFVAPADWQIIAGSAAIPDLPDAIIEYRTVTMDGVARDAVYVTRPAGTVWGVNTTWPELHVDATPLATAAASSTGRAQFFMGDAAHNYGPTTALWGANNGARYTDVADLDGDGVATESYAYINADTVVGASSALQVLKEICRPDAGAADGCEWLSDPGQPVGVAPTMTDILYRMTITNGGSTTLSNVVAYDVLPYLGDTGTSQASASTPRGSTVAEELSTIESVAPALALSFSTSTNPCREEVYPGAPGCVDDWTSTVGGAASIRAALTGTLGAGQSVSFSYRAALLGSPSADALACNSVAVDSASTPPTEPRPVCALVEAADLAVAVPERLPLQAGRPGTVPFRVSHLSGTALAGATVSIAVPAGLRVDSLEPSGWACTSPAGGAPLTGPAALECSPVDSNGDPRRLAVGSTDPLDLAVTPAAPADTLCVPAEVGGDLTDPELANNEASACFEVVAGRPELEISKTDGRTSVRAGETFSYTITVANMLVGETVVDATVTDELPDGLVFVSASDGGSVSGQNADDGFGNLPGGVVTWTIPSLGASGVPTAGGDAGNGAAGSVVELTVTVRVAPRATGTVDNAVAVAAADPADDDIGLSAEANDVDDVVSAALPTVAKSVTSLEQHDDGTWTIVYEVDVTNPNDDVPVDYELADTTAFGAGITISSAAVTTAPAGVTVDPWTGAGTISTGVVLPADSVHRYVITADADAGTAPGTAAGTCLADAAAGFANTATVTRSDGTTSTSTACASPVEPTVTKTMTGAPQQNGDGTWSVSYTITVTNPHESPATGLAYTLDDALAYPTGIDVRDIEVTPPAGATVDPAFTGGLTTIAGVGVTPSTALVDGVARIPAGTLATPAVHEYRVDVTLVAGEGSVSAADATCGTPGAGYGNLVALSAGSSATVLGEASACADIRTPALRFTKSVDRDATAVAGSRVVYTITAANVGDAAFTDADPAQLVDDMSGVLDDGALRGTPVASGGVVTVAAPVLHWSGRIAAGASVTIRYTVELDPAMPGDRRAVNVVARSLTAVPAATPADCGSDATTSDEPCAVVLAVTGGLTSTGASDMTLNALLAVIAAAAGVAIVTAAAVRRRDGDEAAR